MTDHLLIIFVKNPILGQVKTRLAATIGESRTLEVYNKLLRHTAKITSKLPIDRVVYYSNFIDRSDHWDNSVYYKKSQIVGDLGKKMKSAFGWGFESRYKQVCIIGSDCYELTEKIILSAFEALKTKDAVIGPSHDGGYYLFGFKEMRNEFFVNKQWSTDSVASDTVTDLLNMGWNYARLEPLSDVDVEADLGGHEL